MAWHNGLLQKKSITVKFLNYRTRKLRAVTLSWVISDHWSLPVISDHSALPSYSWNGDNGPFEVRESALVAPSTVNSKATGTFEWEWGKGRRSRPVPHVPGWLGHPMQLRGRGSPQGGHWLGHPVSRKSGHTSWHTKSASAWAPHRLLPVGARACNAPGPGAVNPKSDGRRPTATRRRSKKYWISTRQMTFSFSTTKIIK